MKKQFIVALFVALGFSAAKATNFKGNKKEKMDTIKTASGLQYIITQKNPTGKQAKNGDKVDVHYTGKLLNDTIFDSSIPKGTPFSFQLGAGRVIRGWDEGISYLKEGEKATLIIPAALGYGARSAGKIPPNSVLKFDVELVKVTERVLPKPYDVKGKEVLKTASGLQYVIIEEGKGAKVEKGKKALVHYSGYFLDGKMFDSSVEKGQPFTLTVGVGQVIPGWDEGLLLLSVGSKARFIIPYQLGYGEGGYPPIIPAKADLIFDVEILNVQ